MKAGRRVIFKRRQAAAQSSRRILFMNQVPAPYLVDSAPDFDVPMSSAVFTVLIKAAADATQGALTTDGEARAYEAREALARASEAMMCGKPVPVESRWAAWEVHEAKQAK